MPNAWDRLKQRFSEKHAAIGDTEIQSAYLTRGDGTGTLKVDGGQPKMIWLHRKDNSAPFQAYLPPGLLTNLVDGDTRLENFEVRLSAPASITGMLVVKDALTISGQAAIGTTSPAEATIFEAYYPKVSRITDLRAGPTDPPSQSILINPGFYIKPSTAALLYYNTPAGVSLSAAISALTSGQHQLANLYLDMETGAAGYVTNTASTAAAALPSRGEFGQSNGLAISLGSTDRYYLDTVYLYYGQGAVQIQEADFYRWDLRTIFSNTRAYVPITDSAGGAVGHVKTASFTQATSSPLTIFTPPANARLSKLVVKVDTAASGGSPTLSIGVSGTVARDMDTTENNLKATGIYEVAPFTDVGSSPAAVIVTIVPDAQTFTGRIWVYYENAS